SSASSPSRRARASSAAAASARTSASSSPIPTPPGPEPELLDLDLPLVDGQLRLLRAALLVLLAGFQDPPQRRRHRVQAHRAGAPKEPPPLELHQAVTGERPCLKPLTQVVHHHPARLTLERLSASSALVHHHPQRVGQQLLLHELGRARL